MEEKELIREAMRALGKRSSERKTRSCRENARKSWSNEARNKRNLARRLRISSAKANGLQNKT